MILFHIKRKQNQSLKELCVPLPEFQYYSQWSRNKCLSKDE